MPPNTVAVFPPSLAVAVITAEPELLEIIVACVSELPEAIATLLVSLDDQLTGILDEIVADSPPAFNVTDVGFNTGVSPSGVGGSG